MRCRNRNYSQFLVLVFLNSLITLSFGNSGDGPLEFFSNSGKSIIDDDEHFTAIVGSVPLNEATERSDFVIDDDEDLLGPIKTSSSSPVEITEGGPIGTDEPSPMSASSSGIILTVIIVTLVLLSCCAWRVYLVRKKRSAKQRRSLRNHALTANLLEHDKPYRELVEIDKKSADINLNVDDRSLKEPELPDTFSTAVTVEDHEAISKRLSPPPSYDEYLRSSRDNIDSSLGNRLSDLGPTYR